MNNYILWTHYNLHRKARAWLLFAGGGGRTLVPRIPSGSQGRFRPTPGHYESALQADKRPGSPCARPSSSSNHQTLTLGAGSRSCSSAQSSRWEDEGGGSMDECAEFSKPAASRPTSKTTDTAQKKSVGNRPPKGQNDPNKVFNKYGSLGHDTGMEVEASQTSVPSSLSCSTSSLFK